VRDNQVRYLACFDTVDGRHEFRPPEIEFGRALALSAKPLGVMGPDRLRIYRLLPGLPMTAKFGWAAG
jgi:hypothetical protein